MACSGWRIRGLALLLAAAGPGCAPLLSRYVDAIDPGTEDHAKAVGVPPRAPAPAAERSVVVVRFADQRSWSDRNEVGEAVLDGVGAIFTLGLILLPDRDPRNRRQPMSGLDTALPSLLTDHLAAAGTFPSCVFFDRSKRFALKPPSAGRKPPPSDWLLAGEVLAFTGEWAVSEEQDPEERRRARKGRGSTHLDYCRGRIVAKLELIDRATSAVVWSGEVTATEDYATDVDFWAEGHEEAFRNRLAARTLARFGAEVDAALRGALASQPPP